MAAWIAANAVLLLHALFILFVVFGGLLVAWRRWFAFVHLPVAAYGVAIEWIGWTCPLTPLENRLRIAAGEQGYSGGFIEHYLLPLIYPVNYTPRLQLMLGAAVLATNLVIYLVVLRRPSR